MIDIKNNRIQFIIDQLKIYYPLAECFLEYDNDPLKLLIMARLSAQCTDERVNKVSVDFFKKYENIDDIINADLSDIEKSIFSCGLYKTKAKNIRDMCVMIKSEFDGKVPDNMEDLLKLPGVGRKIANLMLGDVFGKPAIVTDTHCIRISNRLELAQSEKPYEVEKSLLKIIPSEESSDFCHRLVLFGREYCKARNPQCKDCFLNTICSNITNINNNNSKGKS